MRSDEGLRQLLDLMIDMAYSTGGAGFATVPPRNTYISDHMTVTDPHAHKAQRLLDSDAWHIIEGTNKNLWTPRELIWDRQKRCSHDWLKMCKNCGMRYHFHDG